MKALFSHHHRNLAACLLAAAFLSTPTAFATPPSLPQEISSFGACVSGDYVYVYGGHTGRAHQHSRENLSKDFLRHPVKGEPSAWEKLPEDKAVQGTALVGWNGLVIRVGGMHATNAAEEEAVRFSSEAVRCYDPESNKWSDWPSLPEAVSSHDAVVMDDVLYVVGGWKLDGSEEGGQWHPHGWSLDLENRDEGWKPLPPMPGVRRAGTLAAAGGEIWWVGGISAEGETSNAVYAFDPKKGTWREGPPPPMTSRIKSFGNSTFSDGERLFTSGIDGTLYALDPAADDWEVTAVSHRLGRIFHRSVPVGDGMFWTMAGAARGGHRDDIEVHPIPASFPYVASDDSWPAFRGGANNEVPKSDLPEVWDDDSNIAWKSSPPGYGQSTPIFGNGGLYVTSAIMAKETPESDEAAEGPIKDTVAVTRLDPSTGTIEWTAQFPASDREVHTRYRSCAAPSPCLDEEAVYAWFETGDLIALDHEGNQLWHRDIGKEYGLPKGKHGLGASLVQDRDSLYLLVDHDGPSYLLSLAKETGETRWKVDREKRVSWSTPVVTDDAIIICSNGLVEERDKATGEQRWVVDGIDGNTVASPLVFRDYVLAPSSKNGQTQLIRRGETDERVVWKADRTTASFASPVFAQGQVILVSKAGIATGLDWLTGEALWSLRLPAGSWATPVVTGDQIYFFSTTGQTLVTSLSKSGLNELHQNDLSTGTSRLYGAIPAAGHWILRTGDQIYAVGNPE